MPGVPRDGWPDRSPIGASSGVSLFTILSLVSRLSVGFARSLWCYNRVWENVKSLPLPATWHLHLRVFRAILLVLTRRIVFVFTLSGLPSIVAA